MKKVITALSNKTVNDKLKEFNEIEIVMNDIQYKDGIIEALEINPEINFIILSELLPGEIDIKDLIEKIKHIKNDIKIIVILEKENKELENYLLSKGNINIFYNNEIKIKEIAQLIINKNKEENLELEIQKLKEIIFNQKEDEKEIKSLKIEDTKKDNKILITENEKREIEDEIENEFKEKNIFFRNRIAHKFIKIFSNETKQTTSKIIIISGIAGVGKSVFTVNLSKALEKLKKKVLIIDFDFLNNSIKTLYGRKNNNPIKNFMEQPISLENLTLKINSKVNLISNIDLLFPENKIQDLQLLKIINEQKLKYDVIILDTDLNNDYMTNIIQESEKVIFITEPNILQIKKTKNVLDNFINELKIEKEKIYILFNKIKKDSFSFNILKEVFRNFNIIGKIDFIKNCNTLINHNMKSIFLENKIRKQYKKIAKKILQNNNIKKYYLNKINENL